MLASVARWMNVGIEEIDIDTDPGLVARYGLRIPVILGSHDVVLADCGLVGAEGEGGEGGAPEEGEGTGTTIPTETTTTASG